MKELLVSIIIPTYNRADLITETLESVIAQVYQNWECIVIDDGSTDNTGKILQNYIKKDNRIKYYHRPKNRPKGANSCRNFGFEISKGEFINWFDSDDIMHPEKLNIQTKQLIKSNLNYSVCQTLVFKNSLDNMIGLRSEAIISSNIFEDYLMRKVVWMTPSAIWKKTFLEQFSYLFDEELQAAQEYEFHCRMIYHSNNYELVDKPLIYIRQHDNSISYNDSINKRMFNYFLARYKIYSNPEITLSTIADNFLFKYLIANFKDFVRAKNIKEALKVYKVFIFNSNKFTIKTKIESLLGVYSYYFFGKGNVFLKNLGKIKC